MHVWGKKVSPQELVPGLQPEVMHVWEAAPCQLLSTLEVVTRNDCFLSPVIVFADEWEVSHEKALSFSRRQQSDCHSSEILYRKSFRILWCSQRCMWWCWRCITYMYGGTYQQVSLTIINTLGNVGGIVCDGAKPSCAAKIASSVDAALMAFQLSIQNKSFLPGEGIIKDDIEETIKSMGYIGRVGMRSTDTEILNVMIDRADSITEC